MPDLWTRIRKARLFQVLVVYVAVSWVILQVADVLEDTLELPQWVGAATLLLLLAGGVVVMATAWLQAHPPAPPEADGVVTQRERVVHRWVLPQLTWPRAIAGGVLALGLLALIALVVVRDGGPGFGPDEARADVAGVGLAVLPFHVSGPDAELWREGMVDLLTTNLDGVAGLRTIDPATVLARMRGAEEADLATRLRVARDVRARYALIGNVIGLASNVRLTAEIHDLPADSVVARARAEGPEESVLRLVDELSVDLVRQLIRSDGGETGLRNAETITTSSLEALRAYLEAERLYRAGDLTGAAAGYERAVREDSTFALAYWGLAWSRGWMVDSTMQTLSDAAFGRVVTLADRLPERTRMFVRGDSLRRAGDFEAMAVFESAVARYPDDPEAWYMLGEVRFHSGEAAGVGPEAMIEPFRRAVALDPSASPYYYHLVPSLIGMGDTIAADSLTTQYERFTGDTTRAQAWRLARTVLTPPLALDADSVRRALEGASLQQLGEVILAAFFTMSYPAALEGAGLAGRRAGAPPRLVGAAPVVSAFEQGRLRETVQALADGEMPPELVPPVLTYVRYLGGDVPASLAARYLTIDFAGGRLSYWAGMEAWLREDRPALRGAIATLDSLAANDTEAAGGPELLSTQADALRAFDAALRPGGTAAAADSLHAVLRRAQTAPSLQASLAISMMRHSLAEMYIATGRPREALALVEHLAPPRPAPNFAYLLATIHDALENRPEAIRYYSIFLEGWRNADEGLPRTAEAERALARLTAER